HVDAVKPRTGTIGIAGEVEQRSGVQEGRMAYAGVVRCDPFRGPTGCSDAPDIEPVRERAPHEVDETAAGCPQWKVTVGTGGSREDRSILGAPDAVRHEDGISRVGCVVDQFGTVMRPVELG